MLFIHVYRCAVSCEARMGMCKGLARLMLSSCSTQACPGVLHLRAQILWQTAEDHSLRGLAINVQ